LKLGGVEPTPAPTNAPAPSPEAGQPEDTTTPFTDDGNQSRSSEKPFDDEPFDAGVEADENTDPKKYIEQLTGKLGQSLRKYNEAQGQPDFELEKFAVNSLLAATHTGEMDPNDQEDIIKKVKTAGNNDDSNNDSEAPSDDNNSADSNDNGGNNDVSGDLGGDIEADSENVEEHIFEKKEDGFLINPKKNNMFQPNSNDKLKESCWKGYKQNGMKDKDGKQVPNCIPIKENAVNLNEVFDFVKSAIESASGDKVKDRVLDDKNKSLYSSLTNKYVNYYIGSDEQIILYNGETGERYPIGDLKDYKHTNKIKENNAGESKNYMFWQNLKTINHASAELLKMEQANVDDMIANGHAWAVDHIATSSDDIEEVYHFFEANLKENLHNSKKSSTFDKIKSTLQETFNQEEKMSEPTTKPIVKPSPTKEPAIKPSRRNKPFLPTPSVQPDPKAKTMDEDDVKKKGYEVYHNSFSSAVQTASDYAEAKGYTVSEDDWFNQISTGPRKPDDGKTNRYSISLTLKNKPSKKNLNIQVFNMGNGRYELNCYIA